MSKLTSETGRKMSVYDRSEEASLRDINNELDRLEIKSARRGARYASAVFYVSTAVGLYEMGRAIFERDLTMGLLSIPLVAAGATGIAMFRNIDKRYKKQLEEIS